MLTGVVLLHINSVCGAAVSHGSSPRHLSSHSAPALPALQMVGLVILHLSQAMVACMAVAQSTSCHVDSAIHSGHYPYTARDKPCHITVLTSVRCAHPLHTNHKQQHQCWKHLQGSQSCRQQWPAALPAAPCSRRNNRHSRSLPACFPACLLEAQQYPTASYCALRSSYSSHH